MKPIEYVPIPGESRKGICMYWKESLWERITALAKADNRSARSFITLAVLEKLERIEKAEKKARQRAKKVVE